MKKSEVLQKLWYILYLETNIEESDIPYICKLILQEIEDIGMLPPSVWLLDDQDWYSSKKLAEEFAQQDKGYEFKWKPENE